MAISAELVKKLRQLTDAPMMDCKKALVETEGDIETAIELMRKSGQAKAAKKASRVTAEGVLLAQVSNDVGVLLEINSETDFVARDQNFQAFATQVVELALQHQCQDVAELSQQIVPDAAQTVEEVRQALISKVGENINLRRLTLLQSPQAVVGQYVHGGRIGVLVALQGGDEDLAKDIAMHIAASGPLVVTPEQVDQDLIAKERDIFTAQAEQSGKPADIIEKMVQGRIKKFLQEVSLLGQPFVKKPDETVADLLKAEGAEVISFVRFVLGEGIEKESVNFADEVMAQVQS